MNLPSIIVAYEHLLDTNNNTYIVRYQEIYTAAYIALPITQSYFKAMKHTDICTVTESQIILTLGLLVIVRIIGSYHGYNDSNDDH